MLVRMQGRRKPHSLLVGMQVSTVWKSVWRIFKKLNREPPYDSAIPVLSNCPKK
jgi:hypothetical protein